MFGLALAVFVFLAGTIQEALLPVALAALVGGAWGAVTGGGIAWALNSLPVNRWKIPASAAASAIVLYLCNWLLPVLTRAAGWQILLGGFLFPLVVLAGILYGKRPEPE